jgi:hypothetical protein
MDFTDLQFVQALGALTLKMLMICGGALAIGASVCLAMSFFAEAEAPVRGVEDPSSAPR